MEIFLPGAPYDDTGPMWGFYSQVLDRVRAIPGVTEAGMSDVLPFQGGFGCTVQAFEDQEVYAHLEEAELTTCAGQEPTTPGYFEAMGIPVLQGRTFTAADNDQPERGVVVVSRAFAQQFWPGEDPIGKGVAPSGRQEGPFYRVVGVVGDVYSSSLEEDPAVAIYYPIVRIPESAGWWPNYMNLVVTTGLSDPLSVYPAIRQAVRDVDPSIPVANPLEVRNLLAESMSRVTFTLVLLGVAAGIALVLAAIGLFGVVSYLVARRRNEIGLRIALGAQSLQVEGMVVVGSLKLVAVGLGLGLAIAYGVSRVLGSLLFGVEPTEPVAYLAAGALVASVALLASWIPARRAAGVDPLDALRAE
jgi:predicted permease